MLKIDNMPAVVIASVMKRIAPLAFALSAQRLPPETHMVKGSKYDILDDTQGYGVVVIVSRGDADHQMLTDRARIVTEQIAKASQDVGRREGGVKNARTALEKAPKDQKDYLSGQVAQKEAEVQAGKDEVSRLQSVLAATQELLKDWQPHESHLYLYSSVEGVHFSLTEGEMESKTRETALEEIMRRLREGEAYATGEIRLVMPPPPVSALQIESWLLQEDKENRPEVSRIIRAVLEGRKDAAENVVVSELPDQVPASTGVAGRPEGSGGLPAVPRADSGNDNGGEPTDGQSPVVGSSQKK